jgi:hypothetical protein
MTTPPYTPDECAIHQLPDPPSARFQVPALVGARLERDRVEIHFSFLILLDPGDHNWNLVQLPLDELAPLFVVTSFKQDIRQ